MRLKALWIVAAIVSVCGAGCATFGQLEDGLSALMGRNESVAFDVLGYPSGKQEFGDQTVYYWSRSASGTMLIPQTSTTYGSVGTTPVYGTTTYNQAVPYNYSCLIKLAANKSGTLVHWEYDGNLGGCGAYIRRLNDFGKSTGR